MKKKSAPVPIQQPRAACTGSFFRQCDKELSKKTLEIKQVPLVSLVDL